MTKNSPSRRKWSNKPPFASITNTNCGAARLSWLKRRPPSPASGATVSFSRFLSFSSGRSEPDLPRNRLRSPLCYHLARAGGVEEHLVVVATAQSFFHHGFAIDADAIVAGIQVDRIAAFDGAAVNQP